MLEINFCKSIKDFTIKGFNFQNSSKKVVQVVFKVRDYSYNSLIINIV
jgi:hypothetical protein